jgi:microcystin-dependent protein
MADPFVAEIRIFPFNFAPKGWANCDGQLMPISQNTALFSLLGTTYGGDGKSTFALPNMQGNAPMHPGQGQGLSLRDLGEMSGTEAVTLLESEIPLHNHNFIATTNAASEPAPTGQTMARGAWSSGSESGVIGAYTATVTPVVQMAFQALAPAGGSLPHNNMQPYLTLRFCIALQGVFPARP